MSKVARWRVECSAIDGSPVCKKCWPTKKAFQSTRISARICCCKWSKNLDDLIVRRVAELLGQQGKEEGGK